MRVVSETESSMYYNLDICPQFLISPIHMYEHELVSYGMQNYYNCMRIVKVKFRCCSPHAPTHILATLGV